MSSSLVLAYLRSVYSDRYSALKRPFLYAHIEVCGFLFLSSLSAFLFRSEVLHLSVSRSLEASFLVGTI